MSKKFDSQTYKQTVKSYQPKPNIALNCLKAFVVGGLICVLGQALTHFFMNYFDFSQKDAANPTASTLILIASILTGLGVYDKIGQFAGAGSAVPITGFANAITSAALEHKSEGYVLGVGSNMFKLAGSVIVFGVVSAYIVGILRFLLTQ